MYGIYQYPVLIWNKQVFGSNITNSEVKSIHLPINSY